MNMCRAFVWCVCYVYICLCACACVCVILNMHACVYVYSNVYAECPMCLYVCKRE